MMFTLLFNIEMCQTITIHLMVMAIMGTAFTMALITIGIGEDKNHSANSSFAVNRD